MQEQKMKLIVELKHKGQIVKTSEYSSFPLVFGRSPQCHLALSQYDFLSRNHGSISVTNKGIKVSDLNSTNGIFYKNTLSREFDLGFVGEFIVGELIFNLKIEDVELDKTVRHTMLPVEKTVTVSYDNRPKEALITIPKKIALDPVKNYIEPTTPRNPNFSIQADEDVYGAAADEVCLQGMITWDNEIYDIRNFFIGDAILIGPKTEEPIYLPILKGELKFGEFTAAGAKLILPKKIPWRTYRSGTMISKEHGVSSGEFLDSGSNLNFSLSLNEVVEIEMDFGLKLYFRYVRIPRPLIKKTLIENRDEFSKAISISVIIHLVLSLLSLTFAPKEIAPQVENMPQRYAKLLVDPPKPVLIPTPMPTPEPIKEIAKEVPTPVPTPVPKPVVKMEKPKPEPIAKKIPAPKQPIQKVQPLIQAEDPLAVSKKVENPQEIKLSQEQKAADDMMNAFSTLPVAGPNKASNSDIKINKDQKVLPGNAVKVSGIVGSLKGQNGSTDNLVMGSGPSLGAQAGKSGYATGGIQGKVGKKQIEGSVVGAPKFKGSSKNGLSNEVVMGVVNKYISEVHRCYERALFEDSSIAGRVEYEWEINSRGDVTSSSVKRSEISSGDKLNNCVLAVINKMKFPQAPNGQTTIANIGFPFGKN